MSNTSELRIEAHLLDFDGDLYGTRLRLEFVAGLRPERRFGSIAELERQLRDDVVAARSALERHRALVEPQDALQAGRAQPDR